jgi:predicted PurR-regulated permease PerM
MPDLAIPAAAHVPPAPPPPAPAPPPPGAQRVARVLLGIGFVLLGLFVLENFLRALVWAAILAVATWPLYTRMQARVPGGRSPVLLPALFTVVSTLVVLVPLVLLAYQAGSEARSVADWVRNARAHGVALPDALAHLPAFQAQVNAWWQSNLTDPEGARALLGRLDAELMTVGRSYGSRVLHSAVNFGFTMLALFFIYKEGPTLSQQMNLAASRLFGPSGERIGRQLVASVHGTVDGLVLVGLGVGFLLGVGYLVAGVPHPVLLGAVSAAAAMIPFAPWIAVGIAALLVLSAGKTVAAAVLAAYGVAIIFIADHFVRPVLIGGATKLPFIWVLLGILGGVETFGLLGLFLGPAVMAALILLWREWVGDAKTSR